MIRFVFQHDFDPPELHMHFLREGAYPSLYTYRPRVNLWTLTTTDPDEAIVVRNVLRRLGIEFEEEPLTPSSS